MSVILWKTFVAPPDEIAEYHHDTDARYPLLALSKAFLDEVVERFAETAIPPALRGAPAQKLYVAFRSYRSKRRSCRVARLIESRFGDSKPYQHWRNVLFYIQCERCMTELLELLMVLGENCNDVVEAYALTIARWEVALQLLGDATVGANQSELNTHFVQPYSFLCSVDTLLEMLNLRYHMDIACEVAPPGMLDTNDNAKECATWLWYYYCAQCFGAEALEAAKLRGTAWIKSEMLEQFEQLKKRGELFPTESQTEPGSAGAVTVTMPTFTFGGTVAAVAAPLPQKMFVFMGGERAAPAAPAVAHPDDTLCVVCVSGARGVAAIPCGHLCLCVTCDKPANCPICNGAASWIKILSS